MVFDKNRFLIGFILLFVIGSSFFLKLEIYLYFIILLMVLFDLYKSKFFYNYKNIYFLFTLLLLIPIYIYSEYPTKIISYLTIFSIFVSLFFYSYIKKLFILNLCFFLLIFFSIIIENRIFFYLIIFISFFNDTCAYLFGKRIGGPLIIPSISPNKTWSGTLISLFLSTILLYQFNFSLIICLIMSLSLFLGDLYFSFIKRTLKVKDFSNLLPGHGGILDRMDSIFLITIIYSII